MSLKATKALLIAMYTAGIIGLNIPAVAPIFRLLTPLNLLATAAFLLYFENKISWRFVLISYFTGFLVEIIGVNTGVIFGEYAYGKTLGPKFLETPFLIGVNWFILAFCTAKVVYKRVSSPFKFAFLGALAMTSLDYLAEPVAIRHDMWSWTLGNPPIQNYFGWFITSSFLMWIFHKTDSKAENPLAALILALQILFFGIQFFL